MKKPKNWDKTVVFSFRINEITYRTVKDIAEREKRSINKLLEVFVDKGVLDYINQNPDFLPPDDQEEEE